jgi:HAD superfamily hydrolase (TIGR01662 family)
VIDVVVPTLGRPSLASLLASLAPHADLVGRVLLVDDRPVGSPPLDLGPITDPGAVKSGRADRGAAELAVEDPFPRNRITVLTGGGHGPAAARNVGWRAAGTAWAVVVDDDVLLPPDWGDALAADLGEVADDDTVAAVAGRIVVPLPAERTPTDWERSTAGLQDAHWATADMAFRVAALDSVCGFDERFPRAYREDADLALRLMRAGWTLRVGRRTVLHPVRPAGPWVSLQRQRGNVDDALMRAAHGPDWRRDASCPRGRLPWHLLTVGAAATTTAASTAASVLSLRIGYGTGRRVASAVAGAAAAVTSGLVGDFAGRRILDGPRTPAEVASMLVTSVTIPPAAVAWRLMGAWRHRGARPWPGPVRGVLFDRDGTLVHDVPYNGDPDQVRPVDGAPEAIARLRAHGLRIGLISNQSGIARGLISPEQVAAVNDRLAELIGPFDTLQVCPHDDTAGCDCRKPAPGLVLAAARQLGIPARQLVVIGDIGADVAAARSAGARSVLVPTADTHPEEVAAASVVRGSLASAVDLVLAWAEDGTGRLDGPDAARLGAALAEAGPTDPLDALDAADALDAPDGLGAPDGHEPRNGLGIRNGSPVPTAPARSPASTPVAGALRSRS